ncbi:MAG TPA: hypothetical protein ENN68_05550 [Methanomicrobia archaeon]|nr:hypothetical protein [Methanomicrobia archaeon]
METLRGLLDEIVVEAERKVEQELSGPAGAIKALFYNLLMPLVLNFQTETECYHFHFLRGGSISLQPGLHEDPDVIVRGEHAEILYLLRNRDAARFKHDEQTGKIRIIPRSFRGSQAVMKLRDLFL